MALDATWLVLVATGSAWLVAHYAFGAGVEAIGLPHWSEGWLMRAHGLGTFAMLVFIGAFLPVHVPRGWRIQRRRAFEITMLALLALTIGTAYALYYFAPDTVRPALGWTHAAAGVVAAVAVQWHRRGRLRPTARS